MTARVGREQGRRRLASLGIVLAGPGDGFHLRSLVGEVLRHGVLHVHLFFGGAHARIGGGRSGRVRRSGGSGPFDNHVESGDNRGNRPDG